MTPRSIEYAQAYGMCIGMVSVFIADAILSVVDGTVTAAFAFVFILALVGLAAFARFYRGKMRDTLNEEWSDVQRPPEP